MLHLRGPVLVGPQDQRDEAWVIGGRVTFDRSLPVRTDAELAFDPIRNTAPDLHPTGTIHGTRALAYRVSQRWRGARPARPAPDAVARTAGHR